MQEKNICQDSKFVGDGKFSSDSWDRIIARHPAGPANSSHLSPSFYYFSPNA